MIGSTTRLLALSAVLATLSFAPLAQETPSSGSGSALLSIVAETMVIGEGGSSRASRDRAVLPPGKTGLLRTETLLPAGPDGAQEKVDVVLKVRAERDGEGVRLAVDSTARAHPSGEVVMRSGGGFTKDTGPLFYEAYVSSKTGHRLVFLLTAQPWEGAPLGRLKATDAAPRAVAYQVQIYRLTPDGTQLIETPYLGSLVGHAASYSFGFSLTPHEEAPSQEELELVIRAVDLREGQLTGILSLAGLVGGLPVSESRSWMLPSGATAQIDLRLGEAAGEDLGFRMVVRVSF